MAKFALVCPHCNTVNKASTFPFAKKQITCANCKNEIDVASNRTAVGECPKCGTVAYDRAKGTCPICRSKITVGGKAASLEELKNGTGSMPLIKCTECGCHIQPSKQGGALVCPVCDHKFNGYEEIFREIQKEKLVSSTGISVIKHEGDSDVLIWKHPIEDFNYGSQLIVHESQEAIFFMNGQALDTFGPGRYSLETESMPILAKAYTMPAGRQNPFHAEVYFINQTVQMGMKWGTDSRVRFTEPNTGLPLDLGASGEMNLQVVDSRKLLIKLAGTSSGIAWDADGAGFAKSLRNCFRPMLLTTIKTHLANTIINEHIDILNFDLHLETLSNALREKISAGFEEFGLTVPHFYVSNIALPDETDENFKTILGLRKYGAKKQVVEQDLELEMAKKRAELEKDTFTKLEYAKLDVEKAKLDAEKAKFEADKSFTEGMVDVELERRRGLYDAEIMAAKGYNQKDVLEKDVQIARASAVGQFGSNVGAGGGGSGVVSDMLGVGLGISAATALGGQMGEMVKGFSAESASAMKDTPDTWACPSCGTKGITGKFCSECGAPKPEKWACPSCGAKGITGKFCSECGAPKPEKWDCPSCGKKGNTGKFCSECGHTKSAPAASAAWDCPSCGAKGVTGKFCAECGHKKEVE